MVESDKFLCSICLTFITPPTLTCISCSSTWHEDCLAGWRKTSETCPICRGIAEPMKNRRLDELIEFLTEDAPWSCNYCGVKIAERRLLVEHYNVCYKLHKRSLKLTMKEARTLWKLVRKDSPLGYVRISVPQQKSKTLIIDIPDLRETPQKQEYHLDVVCHKKRPHRYRMLIRIEPFQKPLRIAGIIESDNLPTMFIKKITKSGEVLHDFNNVSKRHVYLWIYVM